MKYIIQYHYNTYSLDCDCCHDSLSEIYIYRETEKEIIHIRTIEDVTLMEDEEELTQYINDHFPEFKPFTIHPVVEYF